MSFLSITYGIFLLIVFGIYWCVAQQWLRLWTLLIASLVFYASLQVQYIPLLFVLIFINFRLGLAIGENTAPGQHAVEWKISNEDWLFAQADWNRRRLKLLWVGIFLNVFLLIGFKYLPLLLASALDLMWRQGNPIWPFGQANVPVMLTQSKASPLGLSFFCFECIAYLVDVYRGAPATRQFLKFAAYKFFFAKLIAGPITRYHTIASQLNICRFPNTEKLVEGLWLIASGAVKKGLLADNLGIFVDLCFGNLERAGSGDLWLAVFVYGLQLYLDFSGYVDIALGSAILLGLELPQNFNFPYFSTSIADFWRRWHITLGDWLRNYLYFPLGGSRRGLGRTCLNLLIIMLIAGVWHGAAAGYVVWGGLHGFALVIHRLTETLASRVPAVKTWWQSLLGVIVAWLVTQAMVFSAWLFFRLPNIKDFSLAIQHLWGHPADAQFAQKVYVEAMSVSQSQLIILLLTLVAAMSAVYFVNRNLKLQLNWPLKLLLVPVCLYGVWLLAPHGSLPYIYFDF